MRSAEPICDSLDIYAMLCRSQISKHGALSFFFSSNYSWKAAFMPMIGQQNVNSVKTTLYFGPKKSIDCPFFPISHEKITALMPIFCKNVNSLKQTALITSILLKTLCSHDIFFKNFHKNPILSCPCLVKKRQFC